MTGAAAESRLMPVPPAIRAPLNCSSKAGPSSQKLHRLKSTVAAATIPGTCPLGHAPPPAAGHPLPGRLADSSAEKVGGASGTIFLLTSPAGSVSGDGGPSANPEHAHPHPSLQRQLQGRQLRSACGMSDDSISLPLHQLVDQGVEDLHARAAAGGGSPEASGIEGGGGNGREMKKKRSIGSIMMSQEMLQGDLYRLLGSQVTDGCCYISGIHYQPCTYHNGLIGYGTATSHNMTSQLKS